MILRPTFQLVREAPEEAVAVSFDKLDLAPDLLDLRRHKRGAHKVRREGPSCRDTCFQKRSTTTARRERATSLEQGVLSPGQRHIYTNLKFDGQYLPIIM